METRIKNSARNVAFGLVAQIIYQVLNFITRTFLIKVLGVEYNGLNALFSNILSLLSMAELGFGTAIIVSMYKPIADNDERKIKALLRSYSIIYSIIGALVFVLGLIVIPFLNSIVGEVTNIPYNLILVYLLVLANTVFGYYFSYKRSIIIASQKRFVDNINAMIFYTIKNALMITALLVTKNYIIYLVIQPIILILENISISVLANKIFPYIKNNKEKLSKEEWSAVSKNVRSLFLHKICDALVFATDSILISIFLGVTIVGYYSNYQLIIVIVTVIVMLIITQITASVGNLVSTESAGTSYLFFKRILFLHFWILGFCSICLIALTQPFIKIWIGEKYLLSMAFCIVNTICFYLRFSREPISCFKEATQLFRVDRYFSILKVVINFVVSIVLLQYLGVIGTVIGTIACLIFTNLIVEPLVVYKRYFKINPGWYFLRYLIYTVIISVVCVATYVIVSFIPDGGIGLFIAKLSVCLVFPNLVFLIVSFKTDEFKYFLSHLKRILSRRKNHDGQ